MESQNTKPVISPIWLVQDYKSYIYLESSLNKLQNGIYKYGIFLESSLQDLKNGTNFNNFWKSRLNYLLREPRYRVFLVTHTIFISDV